MAIRVRCSTPPRDGLVLLVLATALAGSALQASQGRAPADAATRAASLSIMYPDGMPDRAPATLWTAPADSLTFLSSGGRQFSVLASGHGAAGTVTFQFPISWSWLLPGIYDEAYSSPNSQFPALVVDGCTPQRGRFQIYEAEWTDDGTVTKFAADFEATCQTGAHHVVGAVRFNSTRDSVWPFDGAYPTYKMVVTPAINGIVTGPGIDCGPGHADCAETYPAAREVTLQATALAGYRFVGWAGDCDGGVTTTLAVDFVRRCSAVFNAGRDGGLPEAPSLAARSVTLFSSPGDPLGGGRRVVRNDVDVTGQLVNEMGYVFEIRLPDANVKWTLEFWPGRIVPLPPGTYATPGSYFAVTSPERRCAASPGRFEVYGVDYGWIDRFPRAPLPYLRGFAADFEIRCSPDAPPLVGSIRLNSSRSDIVPFPEMARPVRLVNADVSGDGWPDLVWRHATTGVNAFWIMNGADLQSSTYFQPSDAAAVPPPDWQIRAMGDMNADGHPDVIWQNAANGQLAVWYFSGTTRVGTDYIYTVAGDIAEPDLDWRIVAAGDSDRDGQVDLFWRNGVTGQIRVWYMYGSREAASAYIATVDPQWEIAAAADMNGDGWLDLLWRHSGNGGLAVWCLYDTQIVNTLWLTPAVNADSDWHIVGAADLDRDGNTDLVWQHSTNGQLGVWFMRGLELVWARHLNPWMVADPAWRVVAVR